MPDFKVVGINHYIDNFEEYYNSLKNGCLFLVFKEEGLFVDQDRLAYGVVDLETLRYIGHVEKNDKEKLNALFSKDTECLCFRYSGVKKKDKIYLSLDRVNTNSPLPTCTCNVAMPNSVIMFDKAPYIPPYEYELRALVYKLLTTYNYIQILDLQDPLIDNIADRLLSLSEVYIKKATCSLSYECISSQKLVLDAIATVSQYSGEFEKKFADVRIKLEEIEDQTTHGIGSSDILDRQLQDLQKALTDKGFFEEFQAKMFLTKGYVEPNDFTTLINNVNMWLSHTLGSVYNLMKKEEKSFARGLANLNLPIQELYFVYANILILRTYEAYTQNWLNNGPYSYTPNTQDEINITVKKLKSDVTVTNSFI